MSFVEDKTPSVDTTPQDVDRCKECGGQLFYVQGGQGAPLQEPPMCVRARDESWAFCSGIRRGWTRLTYVAGKMVKARFEKEGAE